ncbi:hypothetical protein H072_10710 [Dactylellina haptotyla CBS 200.50]|uniref:Mitochondrial outer membrane protein iml2 n=1 Tax=Dactylellina haptotyla (strain CBS 200.50) TaxID=1284197 RepID=S8A432_DACHA|nr:hypothetical protein H072_10710 [Dactylellina haptotyla CBS 200.50]
MEERPQTTSVLKVPESKFKTEEPDSSNNSIVESDPFYNRVGFKSLAILSLSFIVIFASIAFFAWLWYSNVQNTVWKMIMVNEWATRAISLTSIALRWAVATQCALGLAMLAAIALEGFHVPLEHTADVSLMRVNGAPLVPTLLNVAWPITKFGPKGVFVRTILPILFLLATSTLVQFTSTALLSDLHLDMISGFGTSANLSIDWRWDGTHYGYIPIFSDVVWAGNTPAQWPAFGELSGPAFEHPNLVDTGMNVRAFVPYLRSGDRQDLHQYNGKMMLLDSRVTCQKPNLEDLNMYTMDPKGTWRKTREPVLQGAVSPTILDTPRFNASDRPTPFDCPFSLFSTGFAICELRNEKIATPASLNYQYAGSLVSEFRHYPVRSPEQDASGAAYIIMSINNTKIPAGNGEWASFTVQSPGFADDKEDVSHYTMTHNVTATLCYSGLDVVLRNVNVWSDSNRTEPALSWNSTTNDFNWTAVVDQIFPGAKNPSTNEERGILNLDPPTDTWAADESSEPGYDGPITTTISGSIYQRLWPYVTDAVHLWYNDGRARYGNYSAILDEKFYGWADSYGNWPQVGANRWIVRLFESVVYKKAQANATVAEGLQMILFSLAGVAYYDQLSQFDSWAEVETTAFVPVLHPGGPHGKTRTDLPIGFTVTVVVVAFHLLVFVYVCWLFAHKTTFSRLGDTWMAIANVVDETLTSGMLNIARQVKAGRSHESALVSEDGEKKSINVGLKVIDGQVHLKTL